MQVHNQLECIYTCTKYCLGQQICVSWTDVYYKQVWCKCMWDISVSRRKERVSMIYKKTIVICHYDGVKLHMYKCPCCTVGTSIIYRNI